jgi:hypothetical protein
VFNQLYAYREQKVVSSVFVRFRAPLHPEPYELTVLLQTTINDSYDIKRSSPLAVLYITLQVKLALMNLRH